MAYALTEYEAVHVPEAMAFNRRMRAAGGDVAAGFLLPEHVSSPEPRHRHYVVLDGDTVRGGCLIETRRHWLAGAEADVWNIQSPLSEGLIDRAHSNVAVFMMRTLLKRNPLMYGVGMGAESRPFPRLLKALGWTVTPVPFLLRVQRGSRFLRELPMLRESKLRRAAARIAAATGVGAVGFHLLHWRPPVPRISVEAVRRFSDMTDALWQEQRGRWSFASVRDSAAINDIYGPAFTGQRWEINGGLGWAVTTLADFQNHRHFGTLRVAAIADLMAPTPKLPGFVANLVEHLDGAGADLIVSNQTDPVFREALRGCGFLAGPSNFIFGASKALVERIGTGTIHVNRGDGDGLINLARAD